MGNGWIKLHRELLDHWVYDDPEKLKIWITLLSKASHQKHKMNVGYELVELSPGELIFGTIKFANAINVSRDKLYRTVKMFEKDGMIKYDTSTYQGKFSIIKILNWEKYQKPSTLSCQEESGFSQKGDKRVPEGEQTPDKRSTNGEQTPNKTNNKDNNVKNVKNDNNKDNIPYAEIVNYLNQKADRNFKPTSQATQRHISGRWNEGFELKDFKEVVDKKCAEWLHDSDMSKYLRPRTLFGTKFEGYLNQPHPKEANNGGKQVQGDSYSTEEEKIGAEVDGLFDQDE